MVLCHPPEIKKKPEWGEFYSNYLKRVEFIYLLETKRRNLYARLRYTKNKTEEQIENIKSNISKLSILIKESKGELNQFLNDSFNSEKFKMAGIYPTGKTCDSSCPYYELCYKKTNKPARH